MKISLGVIPRNRMSKAENLEAVARAGDETGLTRIWLGDRLVYPVQYAHAGDLGDRFPWDVSDPQLEGVVAMTWLLASSRRIGVGVSVMVVPLRQPLVLARQLASLDHLSGGRLTLGLGIGGVLEEYDCAMVDRHDRGARLDEYVEALKVLWTEERPSFDGRFVSFPELYCNPRPAQSGGIPLWFGGHLPPVWDRVVRAGAGLAAGSVTPERAAQLRAELSHRCEAAGRDPESVGLLVIANNPDPDGLRRLLDGQRAAGVSEVVCPVRGRNPEEIAESVAFLAGFAE